jgi:hypothetical protein
LVAHVASTTMVPRVRAGKPRASQPLLTRPLRNVPSPGTTERPLLTNPLVFQLPLRVRTYLHLGRHNRAKRRKGEKHVCVGADFAVQMVRLLDADILFGPDVCAITCSLRDLMRTLAEKAASTSFAARCIILLVAAVVRVPCIIQVTVV